MMTIVISKHLIHSEVIQDHYFRLLQIKERYLMRHIFIQQEARELLEFGKFHHCLKKMSRAMGKTIVWVYFHHTKT